MLRLLTKGRVSRCARLPSLARIPVAGYHSAELDKSLGTKYDSLTDYGSYKNSIFTHRLPESTAQQSPPLTALHSRLRLPESYSYSTLSQALNLDKFGGLANNFGLNTLGKNFLSYYVTESLLMKYPRLPMTVHNAAFDAYMGSEVLAEIGKSWGIEIDKTSKLQKHLSNEPEALQYGKLRFIFDQHKEQAQESGVYELASEEVASFDTASLTFLSREQEAYASAVRAIIGGYYTHAGETATKEFISKHVLSRKVKLSEMFQFSRPTRELSRVCEKVGLDAPLEIRLIAETGRLTAHAMYVAGAFCGGEKLGEGLGSSLNEAKTRAVTNALLSYYLYTPISEEGNDVKLPSDENYKFEGIVGLGDVTI
ncbi:ribonuclease III [Metschnikowia bicuspidata var. bicuspidata NRRL YB-4993]|uniref:Large ribosomal subunit protein mL44 n=1 Tax=Metschnikowia bicuspidata var. bicuspidata NRRL YB-4993 TaxID=869754 RepID=A0A1A0H893_9ASCO|nr:ribonuclease III [Metschnikowia bicuspidata var. bicuspidata NRRL YB-4993]OBA20113.1 ribonuclease III [Metschnikowia bicuspidata var. bicuspidata NRRL YB-4993]